MIAFNITMTDSQSQMIMRFFKNQAKPPGNRMQPLIEPSTDKFKQYDGYARIQSIEQSYGKKAKKTIDKARTSQNYYLSKEIQSSTLNHYENMEWWERDTKYDFHPYIESKK